jgi:hypothetical protein
MHNFKKRFRSSASPCASGVSVALRTRRYSNPPARAVPEMAAITGFGMLSQSAMALSKNPPVVRRVLGPLATGSAQRLGETDERSDSPLERMAMPGPLASG